MTRATNDELSKLVNDARSKMPPGTPMHAVWDVIFDAEAILAGQQSIMPREYVVRALRAFVAA